MFKNNRHIIHWHFKLWNWERKIFKEETQFTMKSCSNHSKQVVQLGWMEEYAKGRRDNKEVT